MNQRQQLISEARNLLGCPWHHCGRNTSLALDCVGLLIKSAEPVFGPTIHDIESYPVYPDGKTLELQLSKALETVPIDQRQPGDVLTFWVTRPERVTHVAILTERNRIIHTYRTVGKVVEHNLDARWLRHTSSCFRFPGVESWPS